MLTSAEVVALTAEPFDRRAIGRDGWARAREIAARLGGEIRDHVAEGMRQAWAAARAMLAPQDGGPAQEALQTSRRKELYEILHPETANGVNQHSRVRQIGEPSIDRFTADTAERTGRSEPAVQRNNALLLSAPAPLPPLTAALSRRRAIFGPVAAGEPDAAAEARAIHLRRQLAEAAEHGAALLASLGLPRLVTPGFAPVDPAAIGDAVEAAVMALDALDGDADLEGEPDDEDAEAVNEDGDDLDHGEMQEGELEPWLGAPEGSQFCRGDDRDLEQDGEIERPWWGRHAAGWKDDGGRYA